MHRAYKIPVRLINLSSWLAISAMCLCLGGIFTDIFLNFHVIPRHFLWGCFFISLIVGIGCFRYVMRWLWCVREAVLDGNASLSALLQAIDLANRTLRWQPYVSREWIDRTNFLRNMYIKALVELLPKIETSEISLSRQEQRALSSLLLSRDEETVCSILDFVSRTGMRSALPTVEKLAGGTKLSVKNHQLRQLAQEAASILRKHADEHNYTLLRSSSSIQSSSEELLHPLSSNSDDKVN